MHGASDATKGDSIDPNQRLPRFLSEPERIVNLMLLCSEIRAKDKSLPLTGLPMMWTVGHLLHGSGFSAQVSGALKRGCSERRMFHRRIASGYLLQTYPVNGATGQLVHISEVARPSISPPSTGRQSCWYTDQSSLEARVALIRAWQKCLRHAMNSGLSSQRTP